MKRIFGLIHPVLLSAGCIALFMLIAATLPATGQTRLSANYWRIVELNGTPVRGEATMSFTRIGWLGVTTPCGPLWGWYWQSDRTLSIHIAGRGRYEMRSGSPCQRLDYRRLLGRVSSFTMEGDRLIFRSAEGAVVARLLRAQSSG